MLTERLDQIAARTQAVVSKAELTERARLGGRFSTDPPTCAGFSPTCCRSTHSTSGTSTWYGNCWTDPSANSAPLPWKITGKASTSRD